MSLPTLAGGYRRREPDCLWPCENVSPSSAVSAVVRLPHGLFRSLVVVLVVFGQTKDDLALAVPVRNWQGLQDHIESVSIRFWRTSYHAQLANH